MDFPWSAVPPRALPFAAEWNGALALPESGNYRFAVASTGPESTFTLLLDDILLLDSSLAMNEQQLELPQGIHRLKMTYRSGNQPGDLRVYWTPPGGAEQILGAPALHSPLLADQGLYGDYYDNDRFEGSPIATHRDPIIGLDPGLPQPYSVRWYGMLAAPRSGEYLIGADAGGFVQLVVDGQTLADNRGSGPAAPGGPSSYTEGLIYLPAGWHPIEVRFTPDVTGDSRPGGDAVARGQESDEGTRRIAPGAIRLLWQPPGALPGELESRYLLPTYGSVEQTDVALPPGPPLAEAGLGDDAFALTQAAEVWHPHLRIPPANLPPLPLERLWQTGGACGSGREQFAGPHGAAFSPAGDKLYIADTLNRRVVVYSVDGALENVITGDALQEPVDVAVAADGALLILDAAAQGMFRLEAGGELAPVPLQSELLPSARPGGGQHGQHGRRRHGWWACGHCRARGRAGGSIWRPGFAVGARPAGGCTGGGRRLVGG